MALTSAALVGLTPSAKAQDAAVLESPGSAAPRAADQVVLKVGEQSIGGLEFSDWLLRRSGRAAAPRYALYLALLQEAAQLGIEFDAVAAERQLNEEIKERLVGAFRGDREAWLAELEMAGRSEEGFRTQRLEEIAYEQVEEAVVRAKRTIDEARIVRAWERTYGPGGKSMRVLGILRRIEASASSSRRTREEIQAGTENDVRAAQEELAQVAVELGKGASFPVLARKWSDDETSREADALVTEVWNGIGWPPGVTEELLELAPGQVTKPFRGRGGVWVLQVESASSHPLEEVRESVYEAIVASKPNSDDLNEVLPAVFEAAAPEYLPALLNPDLSTLEGRSAPVMTVGGSPASLERFEGWLRRTLGEIMATQFALERVVDNEAAGAGIEATEQEIARRATEQREFILEMGFKGSKIEWLERLQARNLDEDFWTREAKRRARVDLLSEKMVRAARPITEADAKATWLSRYGPEGRQTEVRLIRRKVEYPPIADDESSRAFEKRRLGVVLAAAAEFEKLAERVAEGEDFGALAKRFSDDESAVTGGIPPSDFNVTGAYPEFSGEIYGASLGQVVGPLVEGDEVFLFEIIGTRDVSYEAVRDKLLEELRNERVSLFDAGGWRMNRLAAVGFQVQAPMFR